MTNEHRANLYKSDDGQLLVYQRRDKDGVIKPTWYYDIIIPHQKRIRFKSTQLIDYGNALMYAKTQYQKTLTRINAGIPLNSIDFHIVAKEAYNHYKERYETQQFPKSSLDRLYNCINFIFIPYFCDVLNKDFYEITTLDIENLITWRKKQGHLNQYRHGLGQDLWLKDKIPSNATINKELNCLRLIYNYSLKRQLILAGQIPKISNIKHSLKDNRREHFTTEEWDKITRHLWQVYAPWNKKTKSLPKQLFQRNLDDYNRLLNRHFWLILSQSSGRVGEIRNIRWIDVKTREFRDQEGKNIKRQILSVNGKTGSRNIVCMPRALETFERWKEICDYYNVSTSPDNYVWQHPHFTRSDNKHNIGKPVHDTASPFKKILEKLDLLYYGNPDTGGQRKLRSQYSIRHSAITWSLQRNVPIEAISKNVGSSVQTLQRVYDHSVSTDYMSLITQNDPTHMDKHTDY